MPSPSLVARALARLGLHSVTLSVADGTTPEGVQPPSRASVVVTPETALSLTAFYRGVQLHATAICQLSASVERNGVKLPTPPIIAKPSTEESRSSFFEYTVVSFYVDGNAFWLKTFAAPGSPTPSKVVNLTALNPREVGVYEHRDERTGRTEVRYHYRGTDYTKREMVHLRYLYVPGRLRGLGPVEAARLTFEGALEVRDYGARWLGEASNPDGVLTTDQDLKPGDADRYKHVWYGRNPDGSAKTETEASAFNKRERLRVMGAGLKYEALTLKPEDVQFLETQRFNTIDIARLLGAPASLLLIALDGNTQTYANVEQEWIGYVRFTLMKPIREMEEGLTAVLDTRGQVVRFNLEVLLRSDTKTRYEAHELALRAGWQTDDEVRAIEGLPPLTAEQRAQIADARKTAPATQKETK